MTFKRKARTPDEIEIVGVRKPLLRDAYHSFIKAPWPVSLGFVAIVFTLVNAVFAVGYVLTGGIEGAHGYRDAFFFSVQTLGTIGYGAMHPVSSAANALVAVETIISILIIAITTGLVFAKFSTPRARVQFAAHPTIAPYDGVPMLQFRLGNERDSRLLEAMVRVVMLRTEKTREGVVMYRMYDVHLERERSPAVSRSWTVLHKIVPSSPLHGATPESLARDEVEIIVTLTGIDEVSVQQLHAQKQYVAADIRFGARHADMLSERPDGGLRLDMTRFHELVPTKATPEFPYGD
jgi:inward rectifier potassium channel